MVTVPDAKVPKPIEFVAAKEAPLISRNFPAVAICRLAPVTLTPPEPPLIVVVDVVFVDPRAVVVANAPLPMAIVFAASTPILIVPPPPTTAKVFPDVIVAVILFADVIPIAPADVLPRFKTCAAAPVPRLIVPAVVAATDPKILATRVPPVAFPLNKLNVHVPDAIAPLNNAMESVAPAMTPLNTWKFWLPVVLAPVQELN